MAFTPETDPEVQNLLHERRTIDAIKHLRTTYGLSLTDAKTICDRILEPARNPGAFGDDPRLDPEVWRLLEHNQFLPAVKYVRDHYPLGLKEAHDFCKQLQRDLQPTSGQVRRQPPGWLWALVLIAIALIIYVIVR